jgi:NADPH-dependent 2,4-dienoyl-CoA reductase/sulfur reductase-like enzyme
LRIVVIGGNPAGLSAASAIRRLKKNWEINVYEKDKFISYGACGIPYYIADEIKKVDSLITLTQSQMQEKRNIPVHIYHEVIDVNFSEKNVTIKDVKNDVSFIRPYDKLVIATGGQEKPLKEFKDKHDRIYYIHTLNHAKKLKEFLKTSTNEINNVTIIGAGYIGLEMLEAYKAHNIPYITIIGPRLVFESDSQKYVYQELVNHGIQIKFGNRVREIKTLSEKELRIILDDSTEIDSDLLQISVGVNPATSLFREKGVDMLPNGAILTNEYMETNIPDVFAAGDCVASYHRILKKNVYVPLAPAANKQGRIAGSAIAGSKAIGFPGIVGTSIFKVLDLYCSRSGITISEAREIGYSPESILIENNEIAHYMGSKKMTILLVFDIESRLLLGAEITAPSALGAKKIDVFATAIAFGMKIDDIQKLDLSYAPPFAPVWDPILIAANVARKKCK